MRYVTSVVLSLPLIGAYAIFAIGIVLIYRASRVLNLAHGAMAMLPAYVLYSLSKAGVPAAIAFPLALVVGAVLGLGVERVFVRTLRSQGPTAQTVGTVAALGLLVAITAKLYGTSALDGVRIFPDGSVKVGLSVVRYGELGLFVVMLVATALLVLLLVRTDLGLMMRGTAESRLAAALHGVNPDRITELTWALGGGLAALAGILLAAVTALHPYRLSLQALPGFIAALIGGLGSLAGALTGAAIVGITQGMVPLLGSLGQAQGASQLFLAILAMGVMATRGRAIVAADGQEAPAAGSARKVEEASEPGSLARDDVDARRARRLPAGVRAWVPIAAIASLVAVFPWSGVSSSIVGDANLAAGYALVAISLVLLTGWVGQISLGHAALVGIGSYATGYSAGRLGIPFPLSVIPAAAISAGAAALLGAVALRVRGLYLAVATLVFSWMASEYLFRQSWVTRHDQIPGRTIGGEGWFASFDFTDRRVFFLVAWALVCAVVYAMANLRDSKTGRAFFAVRGSEMAAASLGINVMRTKLIAFATSGAIAGIAGNLFMSDARVVTAEQFTFTWSLFFLSVAVVGGLTSLGGAIASALVFAGLNEVFFRVSALGGFLEVVSGALLVVTLLAYRGGLASIPSKVLAALPGKLRPARVASVPFRPVLTPSANGADGSGASQKMVLSVAALARLDVTRRDERPAVIQAEHVTVRFGGLVAVNDASLTVHSGEVVGLIGPNGAGKTTLFNAIAGFNAPASGSVRINGRDVTGLPVHERASVGLARTFQAIQLFRELPVYENLLVATHVHNPSGLPGNILVSERSLRAERAAKERVEEVLELLGLHAIRNVRPTDLPFGTLRMVEVARALVTGFETIMLDEPASGLDNQETDRLMEVIRFVQGRGVTQLLIEHDVRMVTAVSDYMYVLDQGTIIAHGPPDEIQRHPQVIAAYLGEPVEATVG